MKSFKDWIYNELAGKNAYTRMVMNHPGYQGMPSLARKEFINSSFGSAVNSSKTSKSSPPVAPLSGSSPSATSSQPSSSTTVSPSEFLDNSPYKDRNWSKPTLVDISPLSFTQETLNQLIWRCFGFRPLPGIRDDENRTATQRNMLGGSNQPVILFQDGNKYKLQEGWHRTMNALLWAGGAPPDQVQTLQKYAQKLVALDQQFMQSGSLTNKKDPNYVKWVYTATPIVNQLEQSLDLSAWKPVKINAIIGSPRTTNQQTLNPAYATSTADFAS